jgi:site-specific DNA-methyltransferase (adenine-specific)
MEWAKNINIFNSDFRDIIDKYPDNYFDLLVIDPPYGIGESGQTNKTRGRLAYAKDYGNKNWDEKPLSEESIIQLFRVSKNQIFWGANHYLPKTSPCFLVWDKQNGNNDFADCELAWTSFKTAVRKFTFRWNGMLQGDMKNKEIRIHPTQKPVALYSWIFHKYAQVNFKILDTHGGSLSSAIAWHKYSKGKGEFIGVELDKEYYDEAYKRFKRETAQLTFF